MKTIEVTVSPQGETKIETKGFSGTECQQASDFLEQALGQCQAEQLTADYYGEVAPSQRQQSRT